MQESRSAAMLCVGSVGLDHVRGRRGSVAATLAGSALCPVAVIHPSPAEPATTSQVSAVVAEVDNGVVLRHAFEEARLRGVPLRAVAVHAAETPDDVEQGSRLAHVHLSRRLAHWTRLYPRCGWIGPSPAAVRAVIWPPTQSRVSCSSRTHTPRTNCAVHTSPDAPYLRYAVPTCRERILGVVPWW